MDDHEVERLRRSAVMAPPNSRFGTLTSRQVEELCEMVLASQQQTERYREAVAQLRHVLDTLEAR